MDFPRMLYRFPAVLRDAVQLQDGAYDTLIVADEDGLAAADGFHLSAAEAKAAGDAELEAKANAAVAEAEAKRLADAKALVDAASADNAPATRAELEAKAAELGIAFTGKTSDKKLGDQIAAALET